VSGVWPAAARIAFGVSFDRRGSISRLWLHQSSRRDFACRDYERGIRNRVTRDDGAFIWIAIYVVALPILRRELSYGTEELQGVGINAGGAALRA